MPNTGKNQGGSHEQHVRAGQQSHKNADGNSNQNDRDDSHNAGSRGGSHEQHVKAGQQSHKNS
ncbi:hypothetical protein O9Z70_13060 [Devosia sp. YIM 151766]|uniref:hypothetical protein n=1 Tax=Devosia sp. YIM 151766 TaxID=3017325 RepID=UPI00255C9A9F|nr:hypothetical protein [Devosia sp. YIM 151766]WIY52382.1 hypothetical protein O9Z70_13060 [Devosia sp. YIM 151766]